MRLLAMMGLDALAALPLLGGAAAGVDMRLAGFGPWVSLATLALSACALSALAWFARKVPLALWLRVKCNPHVVRITRRQVEDQRAQEALYAVVRAEPAWEETHGPA